MTEIKTNCSATVMPVSARGRIGFLRRKSDDTFGGLLVAPGGKVELSDGITIEGVPYYSVEAAVVRELEEEVGIRIGRNDLHYFCSLTLPHNGRIVLSFYVLLKDESEKLEWLTHNEILNREDFAPGMKDEALMLLKIL